MNQQADELEGLLVERENLHKIYVRKGDCLHRGIGLDLERAQASLRNKRQEMEEVAAVEESTSKQVEEESTKRQGLQRTLDATLDRLSVVKDELMQCKAVVEALKGGDRVAVDRAEAHKNPDLLKALHKVDVCLKARTQLDSDNARLLKEVAIAREDYARQRAFSDRMEQFVREITNGSFGSGAACGLHKTALKIAVMLRDEADELLQIAERVRVQHHFPSLPTAHA